MSLSLRARRREETARAIVDAARRSFATNGYHATRLGAVAREAGCSEATLFRYFPTKADLAMVGLRQRWELLADRLADQPADLDDLTAARTVLAEAVDLELLGPEDPVLFEVALIGDTPELASAIPVLVNEIADRVMAALARRNGRDEPSFRDGVSSRVITSAVWAASQWWFGDQGRPISDLVGQAFDIVASIDRPPQP